MNFIDALIADYGNPVKQPGTTATFHAVGSAGLIMRGNEPTGLSIPSLQSDGWNPCAIAPKSEEARYSLSALFSKDLPPTLMDVANLSSVWPTGRQERFTLSLSEMVAEMRG